MKRSFDVVISLILVFLLIMPLTIICLVGRITIFKQSRIGKHAVPFTIYKLQTMRNGEVTKTGKWIRKYKIDELPQLWNIIKGDMSIVGPRPDLPGYYDLLTGKDREVLKLKPGLTSLAAIKYRNEEELLISKNDPNKYNDQVIFPDKVKMNLKYLDKCSFWYDVKMILLTIKSLPK